jgi:signal transduction histidine kinase
VSAGALSLLASAVAAFGHLVFALAAGRARGPVPRAFARLALVLSAWSAAIFLSDLLPGIVHGEIPWIVALALPPVALELAARVHGAAPKLTRAGRLAWIAAALVSIPLALKGPAAISVAAAILFPGLVAVLWALRSAFKRRRLRARGFLVAAAIAVAAAAIDSLSWFGVELPWTLPRLAAIGSLALVAQLGSSVARHGLFEIKPVLGRVATLAVVALLFALAGVEALKRVGSEWALRIFAWSLLLAFALLQGPLLRVLRSPAARAAARRRNALLERLASAHSVLAHVGAQEELAPALARHLTEGGEIRSIEISRARHHPPAGGSKAVRVLKLRALDRREGTVRLAFADPALPGHPQVRRALRVLADQVAASMSALRLRDEKRRAQRLAELGAVAAELAHEIKNPLGAILGALDLLESAPADEARRWWKIVRDEARRLDRVVTDALALGRDVRAERRAVAPAPLIDEVFAFAREKARAARVELLERGAAGAAAAELDPDLVRHALLNLVLNAIAIQPEGGRVEVAFEERDGSVRFHVRDDGPGIPDELRERVFEPFFTTRATGSGLGLAVAQKVAAAHGGRLDLARPDEGFRGAHFVLELPRAASPAGKSHDGA